MPSVRDLKGRTIEEDAAPISRAAPALPPSPPDVLTPEAIEAKRRVENKRVVSGSIPSAMLHIGPDSPPLSTHRVGPVLPADLEAGLRQLEQALDALATTVAVQVEELRAAMQVVRAKAEADAEAMARLDAVRKVLGP